MQIEMQWYIFLRVHLQLQIATLKLKLRVQTGLLNTSLHHVGREPRGEGVLGGGRYFDAAAVSHGMRIAPRAERQPLLLPGDHVGHPDVSAAAVRHEVGVGGAGDGVQPRPAAAARGLDLVGEEGRVGRDGGGLLLLPGAAAADGDAVVNATKEGIRSREHEPTNHTNNIVINNAFNFNFKLPAVMIWNFKISGIFPEY